MFDDTQQAQSPSEQPMQSEAPAPAPEAVQPPAAPEPPTQPKPPAQPKAPAALPVKSTQEERMWAAIGYIAFLGVVTLAMMPKSEFCKKHAQQGILLFIIWFIGLIVLALPITILSGLGFLIIVVVTIIAVLGIVKSISSYELKLPVLSDLAKMIPVGAIVGSLTGKKPEPTTTPATSAEQPVQPGPKTPEETPAAPAEQPTQPESTEEKPPEPQA